MRDSTERHHHEHAATSWRPAVSATLHCLTGCSLGEIVGMAVGTALALPTAATVALSIALAFGFGYTLTIRAVLRAGVGLRTALRVALASDTVSILVMEVVDNLVMVVVPGAMGATLASWLFWGTLACSLAIAFVATVPVNKWLIDRGLGHAVMHEYH